MNSSLYVDLNKLKIEKHFTLIKTYNINIDHFFTIDEFNTLSIKNIKNQYIDPVILKNINSLETDENHPTQYHFYLNFEGDEKSDNYFLTLVNIILSSFFQSFVLKDTSRKRERRLDVPENLKSAKCSMALLKRAINSKTQADIFNVIIETNDFIYSLADERNDVVQKEYIHKKDEAPELKIGGNDNNDK